MEGGESGQDPLAREMFGQAVEEGQSARRVEDDARASAVRASLRRLGRSAGVRLRTARIDDRVVVARLDAGLWSDDATTMRAKLTPPG